MKNYFTPQEIDVVAKGGKILGDILYQIGSQVQPGVTGIELNQAAEQMIADAGATSAFKGYGQPPYPNALCISVNDCVVHGIANNNKFISGDIVSLDLGLVYQGFFTDMAITVAVGAISTEAQKLLDVTKEALMCGLAVIRPGVTTGTVGQAIQSYVEAEGLVVVREFTGHGVGRAVHQEPSVPNFGQVGEGAVLTEGMILAIEPMVTTGDWHIKIATNHWDVLTVDHSLAAHWEQTIAVTATGYQILT